MLKRILNVREYFYINEMLRIVSITSHKLMQTSGGQDFACKSLAGPGLLFAGAQNGGIDVGAMQPAGGDDPVGCLRHVDPVPAHVRGGIRAHARAILVALRLHIEVVPAGSRRPAASPQSSVLES